MAGKDMQDIAELFEKMRFRKKLLGGVDERDVWRKLDIVQKEYRSVYEAREARFRALLEINGIDPDFMNTRDAKQEQ